MKLLITIFLVAISGLCHLIPGLHSLGIVGERYLYFYKGSFILCSSECFLQDGQVVFYKDFFGGYSYAHFGVFFIAGAISAAMYIISLIIRIIKRIFRKKISEQRT